MRGARTIMIMFLAVLTAVPILSNIFPDRNLASTELREPQRFPGVPRSVYDLYHWTERVNRYIQDHFPFRSAFIRANSKFWISMDQTGSAEVVVGKEGWLFFAKDSNIMEEARGIHTLEQKQVDKWMRVLHERTAWCAERGIDYWFVIIPNKYAVYNQYAPDACFPTGNPTITDQLVAALGTQSGINWIDLRPLMLEKAKSEQIYDKTDSHWNDLGSYYAYEEITRRVGERRPLHALTRADFEFKPARKGGDLARLLNLESELQEDTTEATVLQSAVNPATSTEREDYTRRGWSVETSHTDACRAVLLIDSFTNRYTKEFWRETFSYCWVHHHMNVGFDKEWIENHKPDVVLYLTVERLIEHDAPELAAK